MLKARKRETRDFWMVSEFARITYVKGYDCGPNQPGMWWVPSEGVTASENFHLFVTKLEAIEKALSEQRALQDQIERRIESLEAMLKE
jgi:hypothetical protein